MSKTPLIFGEVLFDCFENGASVLGGAPFNVAWHLQAFGCSPLFVSRVGNDVPGCEIRDAMQHWGMALDGLQEDSNHATGKVQIKIKAGEPSFDILTERAFDYIAADAVPACDPSLIYHGSLGLRCTESALALVDIMRQHPAVPVFMDVNLRPPWWSLNQIHRLIEGATWIKVNENELLALADALADTFADGADTPEEKAVALLQRYNLRLVIVTQGEQGAFAVDEQGEIFSVSPAKASGVIDTVGAGDAFASVCILGLLKQWDMKTTLDRAQAFASAIVGQQGATVQVRSFYQLFNRQWSLMN